MISWLGQYRKPLFIATVIIFLLGTFVGLGGYLFSSRDSMGTVARVGSEKIPYSRFLVHVDRYADALRAKGTDVTDDMLKQIKSEMLRDMIIDQLLVNQAKKWGLTVTDEELAHDIQANPSFQRDGVFSQDAYFMAVRSELRETPESYESWRRQVLLSAKLKDLIFRTAKLTPAEIKEDWLRAHKGSLKGFDKQKDAFAADEQKALALDLINYLLRQLSAQVEIQSFLQQREQGT